MFYCPYFRADGMNSSIRVLNASPNGPPVDVYLNDKLIISNLPYKEFSQYFLVPAGNNNIKVYKSGQNINEVINETYNFPGGFTFNAAIIGEFPQISLQVIPEPSSPQTSARPCIRFVNLSLNVPAIDITLLDGTKVFSNVKYKEYTQYACLPSGTYTFKVIPTGTNDVVLTIKNVELIPSNYYSFYIVGKLEGVPKMEAIITLEGGVYAV